MTIKDQIIKILQEITKAKEINLEFPDNPDFGDYTTNIVMILAKKEVDNPRKLAEEIKFKLDKLDELAQIVEKTEVAGPGFINFWLTRRKLVSELTKIQKEGEKYGTSNPFKGKKIVLEFTDANPFKEFHVGHVYTNTVGESLSRLLAVIGADVHRVNYQGDVGLHVAKAIWGMLHKMKDKSLSIGQLSEKSLKEKVKFMGESYALGSSIYDEDASIKEEINILNKKIFEKNPETRDLYQKGREWSLAYFETIYKRLGTKFDNYYFESEVGKVGQKIVEENFKEGFFEKSQGAIIFPGKKYGLHDRVFINSLGLPTYEAKELGLAPTKYKDFAYDLSIIITGNEINEYFKVLIKAMSLIYPELGQKTLHIGHGMVRLPEGKMSSRTGKIIRGEWVLDEAVKRLQKIHPVTPGVAEKVALGAVKYAFLKQGVGSDIAFDFETSLSFEGNSGPYLQYTVARTNSVLAKMSNKQISKSANEIENGKWKMENEEELVLRTLIKFPEIIEMAAKNYAPNLLCNFLYDLAQKYNGFYSKDKIIGSENEEFRLALTFAVGQVLKNGLKLLGIEAPERM